jgi:hypothetical protein
MASKLVGVRLPRETYRKVQRLRKEFAAASDAEAIRRMIEYYPEQFTPSMMPVFSPRLTSKSRKGGRRGCGRSARDHNKVVYDR